MSDKIRSETARGVQTATAISDINNRGQNTRRLTLVDVTVDTLVTTVVARVRQLVNIIQFVP